MRRGKLKGGGNASFKCASGIKSAHKRLQLTLESTTSCCCGEKSGVTTLTAKTEHLQKHHNLLFIMKGFTK